MYHLTKYVKFQYDVAKYINILIMTHTAPHLFPTETVVMK